MIIKGAERLESVKEYYFSEKLRQIDAMNQSGKEVLNLGIGNPDLRPSDTTTRRLEESLHSKESHRYQSYRSLPRLRKAFAEWYRAHYQVQLDPEDEILPLMGSKEGIFYISMAFLNPGDEVLVPDPGYPTYAAASRLAGATVRWYPLDAKHDWHPDLDAIAQEDLSRVKIMWINYPHMPTGAIPTLKLFEDLVQFARQHELLICHDNPYSFILNEAPMSIFEAAHSKEVTLELNSLSKSHNMPGWRMGMLGGHKHYIDAVLKVHSNVHSGMFRPIQEAAAEALMNPPDWYDALNAEYRVRRKMVRELLEILNCTYTTNQAGMFVWAGIPAHAEDAESFTDRLLEQARVFITPGFVFGNQGNRYLRISLCNNRSVLEEARQRLIDYMKK
jgi:aspartate/methionine/tyrosine aminotransferase